MGRSEYTAEAEFFLPESNKELTQNKKLQASNYEAALTDARQWAENQTEHAIDEPAEIEDVDIVDYRELGHDHGFQTASEFSETKKDP